MYLKELCVLMILCVDFINIYYKTFWLVNYVIPFMSNVSIYSNLSIFYKNVRGLRTKLADIRSFFVLFNYYDMIILTETWLSPNSLDSELSFDGLKIFR